MKKTAFQALSILLLSVSLSHAGESVREFKGGGEVISVDPVYSQITIEHNVITGFSHDGVSDFYVADTAMLKSISKGDLVEFDLTDTKGDAKISKIKKTGVAAPREDGIPLGRAVHDTLQGTGDVLRTVTSPLPTVSDTVGGAVDSTASAADPRIKDGEVKQNIATF